MFKLNLILFLFLVIVLKVTSLSVLAEKSFSKYLPKTKSTKTAEKATKETSDDTQEPSDKNSTSSSSSGSVQDKSDDNNDDEVALSYKLVAIYLIGSEPRALIKNLQTPDEQPKEYKTGEFIDELQKFSISKISFNPTARIELIDRDGLSYLIKPQIAEDKVDASGMSSAKSFPTYSTGKYAKKRDSEATTQENQPAPSQPSTPPADSSTSTSPTTPPA